METIQVSFTDHTRMKTIIGDREIYSDLPADKGGAGEHPKPLELFLSSLASCTGLGLASLCNRKGIDLDEIELTLEYETDPKTGMIPLIRFCLALSEDIDDKTEKILKNTMAACKIKRVITAGPGFEVMTK